MAACQTVISISPAAAAYFGAPPGLLKGQSVCGIGAGPGPRRPHSKVVKAVGAAAS
jgi:hypothetical protein